MAATDHSPPLTIAAETPPDVQALYHELLERLAPSERAELARLLAETGPKWADYYATERTSN